ncbi:protein adenylyltransferase SelO family protein [Sphingopyxis sp. PET50]|uniref:protein adenylyltransferase SelO family protein n=1 Tax=Sphingopyxis sp. PET50 TaxID=2976533 RepID=UPI0021AF639C|nr:protein adenylyltransferase SelO family protein [Sphingopyxis sp. PET50]
MATSSAIMNWNMARFAEALLPAIHSVDPGDVEAAKTLVADVGEQFRAIWLATMRQKLGLGAPHSSDAALIDGLFDELERHRPDFTLFFRALATILRGDSSAMEALLPAPDAMAPWIAQWWAQLDREPINPIERAAAMDAVNPLYIPRNHKVEEALAAAEQGDLAPFLALLDVVRAPYAERTDWSDYAGPAPADDAPYVTFCGT